MELCRRNTTGYGAITDIKSGIVHFNTENLGNTENLRRSKTTFFNRTQSFISKKDIGTAISDDIGLFKVQFLFDESEYECIDVELYAFLFSETLDYLDCVFYKNVDQTKGICYDINSRTFNVQLNEIPAECLSIVFCGGVGTSGICLSELENARVLVWIGFQLVKEIKIKSHIKRNYQTKSARIFASLVDIDHRWYFKEESIFGGSSLHMLMPKAKEAAKNILDCIKENDFKGIIDINNIILRSPMNNNFLSKSVSDFLKNGDFNYENNDKYMAILSRADTLQKNLMSIRSELEFKAVKKYSSTNNCYKSSIEIQLDNLQEQLNGISSDMGKVIQKLDKLIEVLFRNQ